MKAILGSLGVLVAATVLASTVHAQYPPPCPPYPPYPYGPVRMNPDFCSQGLYWIGPNGMPCGPNNVVPPYLPFNGLLPNPHQGPPPGAAAGGPVGFVSFPYARSPRDYFMYEDDRP